VELVIVEVGFVDVPELEMDVPELEMDEISCVHETRTKSVMVAKRNDLFMI
jgi:hypothetical protein